MWDYYFEIKENKSMKILIFLIFSFLDSFFFQMLIFKNNQFSQFIYREKHFIFVNMYVYIYAWSIPNIKAY